MFATDDVLDAIRAHGAEAYPDEGCGFLLGVVTKAGAHRVTATHRTTNRAPETRRARRYAITADDYRAADAAARDQGLDVVGVYHSHPDHPRARRPRISTRPPSPATPTSSSASATARPPT